MDRQSVYQGAVETPIQKVQQSVPSGTTSESDSEAREQASTMGDRHEE